MTLYDDIMLQLIIMLTLLYLASIYENKSHLYFSIVIVSMLASYVSRTLVKLLYELECLVIVLLSMRANA